MPEHLGWGLENCRRVPTCSSVDPLGQRRGNAAKLPGPCLAKPYCSVGVQIYIINVLNSEETFLAFRLVYPSSVCTYVPLIRVFLDFETNPDRIFEANSAHFYYLTLNFGNFQQKP